LNKLDFQNEITEKNANLCMVGFVISFPNDSEATLSDFLKVVFRQKVETGHK
jgi:hypothetical protein